MPSHSIWLVPDRGGPTFARLRQLIETLASRCGGDVFDPHVTLVGSLAGEAADLCRRAGRLAHALGAFDVKLGPVVARPLAASRFRRFFSAIEPTDAVVGANTAALAAFAVQDDETYEPHLSLAYADVDEAGFAALKAVADESGVNGLSFQVEALELWRTEGPVPGWRREATFRLAG